MAALPAAHSQRHPVNLRHLLGERGGGLLSKSCQGFMRHHCSSQVHDANHFEATRKASCPLASVGGKERGVQCMLDIKVLTATQHLQQC